MRIQINVDIGLYPYTFSSPKCEIPCKPILIEKSKTNMMRLYGSKFDIFEYEVYNTIKAANVNNPFIICAYIDGVIIYIIYYIIIIFKIFAYYIMSTRKEQKAQQAANKAAKDQIREIQKQRVRREEVLTEMLIKQQNLIRDQAVKIRQAESAAAREGEARAAQEAKYRREDAFRVRQRNAGIDQDNRHANAVANVNAYYNQIQAAAADVGHDGEFDMPQGIEYTSEKKGFGDRKKSAKKRKTKKRTTKRRIYKNKSNKRI
jgi:hypothetical protein